MKNSIFLVKTLSLISLFVFFTSCGKSSFNPVKGLKVTTTTIDNEVHVQMSSDLDFGNILFPSLSIPIQDPHGNGTAGTVSLIPAIGGKTQLVVEVNASRLSNLQTGAVALPNGGLVPFIATNSAVTVNLGNGAKLYIAASDSVYALGVAIPISGLDSLGSGISLPINLFPTFTFDKATGAAGIFTSPNKGQNGFAFVVDASAYVIGAAAPTATVAQAQTASKAQLMAVAAISGKTSNVVTLDYTSQIPSSKNKSALENKLYQMHLKRTRLAR